MNNTRNKSAKIIFAIGILSIIYFFMLISFSITISFSNFWLLVGIMFIIIGFLGLNNKHSKNKKLTKIIYKIIACLIIVFILIEIPIIYYGNKTYSKDCDYIIILGAGLNGRTMSLSLYQRMEKSMEYIKNHPDTKIIVSGGQGAGELIPEAEAMKNYLVDRGVDENRIIKEDKSTNTYENMRNTKVILGIRNKDMKSLNLCVVTNNFHVARAKMLGRRMGMNLNGIPAPTHKLLVLNFYVRESLAFVKSYILDR